MDVRLGAKVMGSSGNLGTVEGMIANKRLDGVENLIVRQGGFASSHERVLPLSYVVGTHEEGVQTSLDDAAFEQLSLFTEEGYEARQIHYTAPVESEQRYDAPGEYHADVMASQGYRGYLDRKVGGYPGGEQTVPDDQQLPVIRLGMDVLDLSGEKLGELGELVVHAEDGMPVRFGLREGLIIKRSHELPIEWIKELAVDGIVLNVGRHELEERERAA